MRKQPIRVLIVDDSSLVQDILSQGLSADPDIEVVGTAEDPYEASELLLSLRPDVLTLDIEMPKMDGLTFLRKLMAQHPIPVVMVSTLTQRGAKSTFDALEAGAIDFVAKPTSLAGGNGRRMMIAQLAYKIKIASMAKVGKPVASPTPSTSDPAPPPTASHLANTVIVIGASTGGTEAIKTVLTALPAAMPGIVVVQHMPPKFTETFAERLDKCCRLKIQEAKTGDRVVPGRVLIAPGGFHMTLASDRPPYTVICLESEKVNGHRPSVDVLMHSVVKHVGAHALGVILTGMGRDGALGLKALRDAGAFTIGQDEKTSAIYGMPKVAYTLGAVVKQLPIHQIGPALVRHVASRPARSARTTVNPRFPTV